MLTSAFSSKYNLRDLLIMWLSCLIKLSGEKGEFQVEIFKLALINLLLSLLHGICIKVQKEKQIQ